MSKLKDYTIRQALHYVLLSVLLFSLPIALGVGLFRYIRLQRVQDAQYMISSIDALSLSKNALEPNVLAEILGLSSDDPKNIYAFSSQHAVEKLVAFPLIEYAEVHKIMPDKISIIYKMREPIAALGDYSYTYIDAQRTLFPQLDAFCYNGSFKLCDAQLPTIFIGTQSGVFPKDLWGMPLKSRRLDIALEVLQGLKSAFPSKQTRVVSIDVSQALALSCGQKEIVVLLEENIFLNKNTQKNTIKYVLRLAHHRFDQQIKQYKILRAFFEKQSKLGVGESTPLNQERSVIIDLRIPSLAYIKDG